MEIEVCKPCFPIKKKSNVCIEESCNKSPSFNYIGTKIPLYCSSHKLDDMIDIVHKKCTYKNCIKYPCFNYKNQTKGLFCLLHKL